MLQVYKNNPQDIQTASNNKFTQSVKERERKRDKESKIHICWPEILIYQRH